MVNPRCPRLVLAGTGSGVGKTSLAIGLSRELARRGLRVQTFKVGPDFLDPTYLAIASGRTCYNLDGWMTSRQYVGDLFCRATAEADLGLIEGVMGLFDGASASTLEGSTAEIAAWLDAPVLLVACAHGTARSMAAVVKGFAEFEPGVRVAGVIANRSGSRRHGAHLAESLATAGLPPLVGAVPRGGLPTLPSRHLGLVTADADHLPPDVVEQLADACREHLDVAQLIERAGRGAGPDTSIAPPTPSPEQAPLPPGAPPWLAPPRDGNANPAESPRARLGIAWDEAFHFYYPDNLESLRDAGAQWHPFSPLADSRLPAGLDGLYFGGGYPEIFAARLAENRAMRAEIRDFAASGGCIYAECGGLMYLGRRLATLDGARHPMLGILPVETAMLPRLKALAYTEVSLAADSLWGRAGSVCRGHEFHYSEITAEDGAADGWQRAYAVRRGRGDAAPEGFARGNVLASYVHLHWASRPEVADHFLARCEARG